MFKKGIYTSAAGSLIPGFTRELQDALGEESLSRGTVIRASVDSHCARRGAMRMMYIHDTSMTPQSRMYTTVGEAIHIMLTSAMWKMGVLVFKEYNTVPPAGVKMRGTVDAIVYDEEKNLFIADFKTCGKFPDSPAPSHCKQLATYSWLTGIDHAELIYVTRSPVPGLSMMRSFTVNLEKWRPIAVANIARTCVATEANIVPPGFSLEESKTECLYCPFQSFCWKNEWSDGLVPNIAWTKALEEESMKRAEEWLGEMESRKEAFLQHCFRVSGNKAVNRLYYDIYGVPRP